MATQVMQTAQAATRYLQVFVTAPYLEMHTGPGRGYPVFHVVGREGSVLVIKRYTDWFKVRAERGIEGWVPARDLRQTVLADGSPFTYDTGDRNGFTEHRFEAGIFFYGDYGGASALSGYAAAFATQHLSAELSVGQFLGKAENGTTVDLGVAHVFYPQGRFSPFVTLGTGLVHLEPKVTLVEPANSTEQTAYVGGGFRFYLTRRFFVRGEFREHEIFTHRNVNEQVDEWKLGFAFFF